MQKTFYALWGFSLIFAAAAWGISSEDIQRLHAAGLSGETIQVVIREKVVETCAFTVQELIDLKKKAKLSDKTMQMMISEGSFLKDRSPVVYGQDVKPLNLTTADDIIKLKQAGVSDDVIQAIIISGSSSRSQTDRERAWQMLNSMGIVVDSRK